MKDLVLILPQKNKSFFSPPFEIENGEGFTKLYIRESKGALKKAKKFLGGRTVVVSHDATGIKFIANHLVKYNDCDGKQLISLVERAITEITRARGMNLPIYEIYIYAHPSLAVEIIEKIKSHARLFTIVTNEQFSTQILDGLYFKYGIIIRHLTKISSKYKSNSIIISTDSNDNIPNWIKLPVISLAPNCTAENALLLRNALLKDNENSFIKAWNGGASAGLYSLLNIGIDSKISIDITEKGDEIFVLDIT